MRTFDRFIQTSEYIAKRIDRAPRGRKEFWTRMFDANERRLKQELAEESTRFADELIQTSRRLHARK